MSLERRNAERKKLGNHTTSLPGPMITHDGIDHLSEYSLKQNRCRDLDCTMKTQVTCTVLFTYVLQRKEKPFQKFPLKIILLSGKNLYNYLCDANIYLS